MLEIVKKLNRFIFQAKQYFIALISACIFSFCCFANVAYAINLSTISQVIFFGDSLTDSGFNDLWPISGFPPLPAGKQPTFTTYGGFTWSGANDFLTLITAPTLPTQLQLLMTAQTAAVNIANEVAALSSRGAKRIVVMSLPNLGLAPFVAQLGDPALKAALKTISFTF